jgi:serine/threonine protein kinase
MLAEKLINAMWKYLLSNNFTGSATNLNICRDGQGYFARCTEDLKYAIEYPSVEDFAHLKLRAFSETELQFVHHWAGWVYVVSYDGIEHVKKEIPMQEQVESFSYELDALSRLQHSPFVLDLYGVVTDGSGTFVKGMLVEDLRPLGAVIRNEGSSMPLRLKMRWAKQILAALGDIHKMGIVMGEVIYAQFGLTRENNIKAMSIKKRGCPTGWEPPEYLEIKPKGQNAGIFGPQVRRMGQMMDMYQAGLCLWMLATDKFPENYDTLPPIPDDPNIPGFYRDIVKTCLQKNPGHREDASSLLRRFPPRLTNEPDTATRSLVSRL